VVAGLGFGAAAAGAAACLFAGVAGAVGAAGVAAAGLPVAVERLWALSFAATLLASWTGLSTDGAAEPPDVAAGPDVNV
jgi:hypothetical protein